MDRRAFVRGSCAALVGSAVLPCSESKPEVPGYLKEFASTYADDPKTASLEWFKKARFGLFMHYGLYSLLGRGEWVMLREAIPIAEYELLKEQFRANRFDPDYITDLALEAGMTYINLTSKHHDGFCLFHTQQHEYNSYASSARRDLVASLSEACRDKGLGLFLYYSYFADWWHPFFYPREVGWQYARPAYDFEEPRYRWERDEDFRTYVEYVHEQLRELLTYYGPVAGIWFDPIMGFYHRPDLFPIAETYALVRSLQPHTLVSAKQGADGTEDFAAPERHGHSLADQFEDPELRKIPERAWEQNMHKHNEICDTLQPRVWGYRQDDQRRHKNADEVMEMLEAAEEADCNLLLNTGPLPDGSIDPVDAATLLEVGKRLRSA